MAKGKYERWLEPQNRTLLEGWARQGLSDEQIAHNVGISRSTLNVWRNKYPDISDAIKKGKQVADFEVENALFKRATGYMATDTTKELIVDSGQRQRHQTAQGLTEKDWEFAKAYFEFRCAYCGDEAKLTKDHLDPLDNGGDLVRQNVVPACQRCNSSKKDVQWLAWYGKQKWYSKDRARRINEYVNLMYRLPDSDPEPQLTVTRQVTRDVPPDTTAAIFWLKSRDAEHWRETYDLYKAQVKQAKADASIAKRQADELADDNQDGGVTIVDNIPDVGDDDNSG